MNRKFAADNLIGNSAQEREREREWGREEYIRDEEKRRKEEHEKCIPYFKLIAISG